MYTSSKLHTIRPENAVLDINQQVQTLIAEIADKRREIIAISHSLFVYGGTVYLSIIVVSKDVA